MDTKHPYRTEGPYDLPNTKGIPVNISGCMVMIDTYKQFVMGFGVQNDRRKLGS